MIYVSDILAAVKEFVFFPHATPLNEHNSTHPPTLAETSSQNLKCMKTGERNFIYLKKNSKHASWEMYYAVSKLGSTLREGSHSKTNMEPHWLMCTHEGVTRHVLHVNVPSDSCVKGQVTFLIISCVTTVYAWLKVATRLIFVLINCRFLSRVICLICVVWG